jgi:nucleoside-diphosphate-sugar epimerase
MVLPLLPQDKIIITGAAGLVGQNLCILLREHGYSKIIALDKRAENLAVLKQFNPEITAVHADLASTDHTWSEYFADAKAVIQLHAHIGSLRPEAYIADNITATEHVLAACRQHHVPWLVHASSSVVNSAVVDDYTESKKAQEKLVRESGIAHVVLRPTLMFGWFDRKHLGWLSRLMQRSPIFPIPGHGHYPRQPLYVQDFCQLILRCLQQQPQQEIYDVSGSETISYLQMIRDIRTATHARSCILRLPVWLFGLMLDTAGLFTKNPPFTRKQMHALMTPDHFSNSTWEAEFQLTQTPWKQAVQATFNHPEYSYVALRF